MPTVWACRAPRKSLIVGIHLDVRRIHVPTPSHPETTSGAGGRADASGASGGAEGLVRAAGHRDSPRSRVLATDGARAGVPAFRVRLYQAHAWAWAPRTVRGARGRAR